MTPDDLDLARRLVEHERFEWPHPPVCGAPNWRSPDGVLWRDLKWPNTPRGALGQDWVPDLHDAATGGVLLDMLREAAHYHNPTLRWESETRWYRVDVGAEKWFGPTVGIAVAQALLEVWS